MSQLALTGLSGEALTRVAAVACAPLESGFAELAKLGGLNPATDFRHRDLRGWPLRGEDVRGFDFTGADLRGTGIEAAVRDGTTVLVDALLDVVLTEPLPVGATNRVVPPPGAYTKVRIPDLSDAELLEKSFVIADPLALENITSGAPPVDQWLTYEGRYDVGEPVTCAFAHRHKRGYVFRDEKNRRYLVGNTCGGKHLGLGNWQSFTKGREGLEDRAGYLRLIRDLADAFRANREWIASLPNQPAVQAYEEIRRELWRASPGLVKAVKQTVLDSEDGLLTIELRYRDEAAEKRRRERQLEEVRQFRALPHEQRRRHLDRGGSEPKVDQSPIFHYSTVSLGKLRGASLFRPSVSVGAFVRAEILPFVDAFLSRPSTNTTRKALIDDTRSAKALVERLFRVQQSIYDAFTFFEADNLLRIAQWADHNKFDGCHFSARPGRLVVSGGGRTKAVAIERTDALRPLSAEPFEALRVTAGRASERAEQLRRR